ncbi:MAG: orotate phosphoribosyltransferase [Nitrospirae bacterium]|nr:orotate phosphoribosyltransferase [Nitrospirota bacterium]
MQNEGEILNIFRQQGALLEGHFLLSSGLHSETYLQCALVLQNPDMATEMCFKLGGMFRGEKIDFVIAPALGGIIVAHEVAKALGVRALFAERVDGKLTLRRGFTIAPGERALVVEDVVTTGGSTVETMRVVTEAGGVVVGAGSIIDRSGGTAELGVPYKSLVTLSIKSFQPKDCPLCQKGIPAVKPGSRNLAK